MSKFFAAAGSDNELSSSDEEELYSSSEKLSSSEQESEEESEEMSDESEEESGDEEGAPSQRPGAQYLRNQFLKGAGSSSESEDSEDERVVVKSAKEKTFDEVDAEARTIDQAGGSRDWLAIQSAFDKLVKSTERSYKNYRTVPVSFCSSITLLGDLIAKEASEKRKLNSSTSKALNITKQRLKKAEREFSRKLGEYRANPDSYNPAEPLLSEVSREQTPQQQEETPELDSVFQTLLSVIEQRGKKHADRQEQISTLDRALAKATTTYEKISVLLILIPIRFDLNTGIMPLQTWKAIESDIRRLFAVLESQDEYVVIETAAEVEDFEKGPAPGVGGVKQIPGSVSALIERLDDEHAKALQVIDPHTQEYIDRLRDESVLQDLFLQAQCYIEKNLARLGLKPEENEPLCRVLARRLEHAYYKPLSALPSAWPRVPAALDSKITPRSLNDPTEVIGALCSMLFRQPNPVLRAKAMLSLIFHYALTDRYYDARDLMLMSHLQSSVHTMEPSVQVLFNRTLVQLGLCAFRAGLISESLQCLQELCSSSRLKDLLGQGQGTVVLPFHTHINLEMIECVYLTASMLIEIPYLAQTCGDTRKRAISRPFRRLLDYHDRQVFSGPSENTRDSVIQAAKCLQEGDWHSASNLLSSIKIWNLLASETSVLDMLSRKLKIEGLKTYLLTYGPQYSSLSLQSLRNQFELEESEIRSLVTKMIVSDEIPAVFDESSAFIIFRAETGTTKLQALTLALAEKLQQLGERNERLAADGYGPEPVARRTQRPVKTR